MRRRKQIGSRQLVARRSALIQPRSASAASIASVCAAAQLRLAAAGDQLLRLHEELDLADAAAAELDVVAGDRDRRRWPLWAWICRLIEWMSAIAA